MAPTIIRSAELASVFGASNNVIWQLHLHCWADESFSGGTDESPTVFLSRNGDITIVPSKAFVIKTFAGSDPSCLRGLDFKPQYGLSKKVTDLATLEDEIRKRLSQFGRGLVYVYDVTDGLRFPIEIESGTTYVIDKATGLTGRYLHVIMPQSCTQALVAFFA